MMKRFKIMTFLVVFMVVFALQTIPTQAFPVSAYTKIYEGVLYATGYATSPRLMRAFALKISLRNSDVGPYASHDNGGSPYEVTLEGTDAFRSSHGLKVAANCCHWDTSTSPYVDVLGLLVSAGTLVSPAGGMWPGQMYFTTDKTVTMTSSNSNPPSAYYGLEVGDVILTDGVPTTWAPAINPYTAYGISQDGHYLIIVCVDGRQPGWSEGCTYAELGQWLKDFGAWNGRHADGGGSTCMVTTSGVVNRPCYGYVRPVAASLGVWSDNENRIGPSACSMNPDRIDIAYRGNLQHVFTRTWTSSGGWGNSVDLGGSTGRDVAIVSRSDGNLMVLHSGGDNAIYYKTWTTAGGWSSSWTSIGGSTYSGPRACRMNDNRIDVVARGSDNAIKHISWINGTGWSAWESLGGSTGWPCAIHSRYDGQLAVYHKGDGAGYLYEKNWYAATGWNSRWDSLGGALAAAPTSVARDSTHQDVYARGTNGHMMHISFTQGVGWSSWEDLAGDVGDLAVCCRGANTIVTYHRGGSDQLFSKTWTSSSGWTGYVDEGYYFE